MRINCQNMLMAVQNERSWLEYQMFSLTLSMYLQSLFYSISSKLNDFCYCTTIIQKQLFMIYTHINALRVKFDLGGK